MVEILSPQITKVIIKIAEFNYKNIFVLQMEQLFLLQISGNVVTNWGIFIITNWSKFCYKLEQPLQIKATVIMK